MFENLLRDVHAIGIVPVIAPGAAQNAAPLGQALVEGAFPRPR